MAASSVLAETSSDVPKVAFAFGGEGAHAKASDLTMVKLSPSYAPCVAALATLGFDLDEILEQNLGEHEAPRSVIITTVINICLCDLWKSWGYSPNIAFGHSVGELAAAYASGMMGLEDALTAAVALGDVAAKLSGGMLHTKVASAELQTVTTGSNLAVAAVNSRLAQQDGAGEEQVHVTLCGPETDIAAWLTRDSQSARMRPKHPWHHPSYSFFLGDSKALGVLDTCRTQESLHCKFVSATTADMPSIDAEHWKAWLTKPVNFAGMVDYIKDNFADQLAVVEIGSHPVLSGMLHGLKPCVQVSSMCRDQESATWMMQQRSTLMKVLQEPFLHALSGLSVNLGGSSCQLVRDIPFAAQGITSTQNILLAQCLEPFFPGVKPFDLYRFTSLDALIAGWGQNKLATSDPLLHLPGTSNNAPVNAAVLGVSLILPPGITSCDEFWAALSGDACSVRRIPGRKHFGGYLAEGVFDLKRDGASLGIESAEAGVIDPQQVLALSLAKKCLEDAGQEVAAEVMAAKDRCGVYIGAWQEPPQAPSRTPSAYRVLGTSLSAISSRVANTYNFQGPAITVNTACSSGLVAVDNAIRDLRDGIIDYALVGGVNLLTDESVTSDLDRAKFLSPTGRCHTFSEAADGYARSEGGVMFILSRDDGKRPCRALVLGAATNQNSQRRPITAVDPGAQERVIRSACEKAGVQPSKLAVVECHGTGTKLGDPVEMSALAATVGADRSDGSACQLTAAKMIFGHLESAAGSVGLLKAVLMAQHRSVPGNTINKVNPAVKQAIGGAALRLPSAAGGSLSEGALIGVSSFGFTGTNSHAIVQVAPPSRIMPIKSCQETASRNPAQEVMVQSPIEAPLDKSYHPKVQEKRVPLPASEGGDIVQKSIWAACEEVCKGISEGNQVNESIFDLGIDSLGLAEMLIQLEAKFGEGCVTVDDVMANPTVSAMTSLLQPPKAVSALPAAPKEAQRAVPAKPAVSSSASAKPAALKESKSAVPAKPAKETSANETAVRHLVWKACEEVCNGISEGNQVNESIFDLGIDSLGLAEMLIQLEAAFGEGCITVDDVMANPTVSCITSILTGAGKTASSVPQAVQARSVAFEEKEQPQLLGGMDVVATPQRSATQQQPSSKQWLRTTHIGSLPRPTSSTPLDDVISQQVKLGIDWINDGECTRENYISDMLSRISGVGGNVETSGACMCNMPCADDMHDVPIFCRRYTGGNGLITLNPSRVAKADVACTQAIEYVNPDSLYVSLQPFLDAIGSRDRSTCFWSVPSPGTLAVFCEDRYYGNHTDFTFALSKVLQKEYEAVAATGLCLQVDGPDLAMGRHTKHAALTDEEFLEILRISVDAINAALINIDPSQVRVHVCWGNYPGPHHKDIEACKIWPQLLRLKAKYISIEGANARHSHDWDYFVKNVAAKFIEQDMVIMPGVLDTRSSHVEHPELVAQRLLQYAHVLGPVRVVASTDCGFATTAKSTPITEDIVSLKLEALVKGARLARQQLINQGCPAPTSLAYSPTGFRAVLVGNVTEPCGKQLLAAIGRRAWSLDVLEAGISVETGFERLKFAIDTPVAIIAKGAQAAELVQKVVHLLGADRSISRRPFTIFTFQHEQAGMVSLGAMPRNEASAEKAAAEVQSRMQDGMRFDKQQLLPNKKANDFSGVPPVETDVVIVGAGLLGLYAAVKLVRRGYRVCVLEQRLIVGGIWSMYANSHSQVNSSEGGYSLKDILGEEGANRDHSTAREMITDIAKLAKEVDGSICCGVKVSRVAKQSGGYMIVSESGKGVHITASRGVILAINDRVGTPRAFHWEGQESFKGTVTTGTNDNLAHVDWRGKRVVVVGMGAFAIENTRTALEHGADHVTVLVRRHGTVCPKIIDYLNFVKPFDDNFQHDAVTNIKQMREWSTLYRQSGATIPECWPGEIKHEGHTISVSDLWFVGHHMGKLCTRVAGIDHFDADGVHLSDGSYHKADVVVACIGFHRNTVLCEAMTGLDTVKTTNYLDKHMMYLADAEIDHGAFNWFFGSSVLEYAKFFTEVYIAGLDHEEEVGEMLWGDDLPTSKIQERKWSQYIAASAKLLKAADEGIPYFAEAAKAQVEQRTKHFYSTLPPNVYVKANEAEWVELHTRLNGGKPVPPEKQLPYFFKDAATWCEAPKKSNSNSVDEPMQGA